jgi:hypothetical protein
VRQIPSGKWNVLLVFNPQDLSFAGAGDGSNSSLAPDVQAPDSSAYVHVSFLKATAVPYREGEDVMRETYEFTVTANEAWMHGEYGMRLELYLIGDKVVAANVNSYPTDGMLAAPDVPVIFFAEADADGSLSLQGYDHGAIFDAFVRKAAVGETGAVTWNPGGMGGFVGPDLVLPPGRNQADELSRQRAAFKALA